MRALYLIRHGRVAIPEGVCYGRSDIDLAESADQLADRLRARLPEKYVLWSSPLSRCRQLAEKLGEPRLDARLMEMNFGDWEMRNYDAIDRQQIDAWAIAPVDFCPPNGESVSMMQARVHDMLATMLDESKGQDVVAVSHAGPIRIIWGRLFNLPEQEWLYKPIGYGEILHINRDF